MDTRIPNEDERKKLREMAVFYHHLPIYGLSLLGIFGIDESFFNKYPMPGTILAVLILAAMIYLLLNFALLKRCPRCSSWGTPIVGGNCPKCGLHLDPSYKEN
jgi:hypothetical protein